MPKLTKAEQSRVNGAKSKGPTTTRGKLVSSKNALKSGRFARDAVLLSTEDPDAYLDHIDNFIRQFQPASRIEYGLCRELAALDWRLRRNLAVETSLIEREIERLAVGEDASGIASSSERLTSEAHLCAFERSALPRFLAQREAQLQRSRRQLLALLTDFRKKIAGRDNSCEIIEPITLSHDSGPEKEPEPENVAQINDSMPLVPRVAPENEPDGGSAL